MDKRIDVQFPGMGSGGTLRDLVTSLKRAYSSNVGFEYFHILDLKKVEWLRARAEDPAFIPKDREKLLSVCQSLVAADTFESFLGSKYKTTKRFGVDGGEAAVVG